MEGYRNRDIQRDRNFSDNIWHVNIFTKSFYAPGATDGRPKSELKTIAPKETRQRIDGFSAW